jgi:chitodextrinase
MARLLTNFDYLKQIQTDNLLQIIEDNYQTLYNAEQAGQAEMKSYLVQRYVTDLVFSDTTVFSISAVYGAKNLVYLDASAFSAATVYLTGDLVLQGGNVYHSTSGSIAHAFDASEWDLLGAKNTFFHVALPNPEWLLETTYSIGDDVWYNGSIYTCVVANSGIIPSSSTAYWGTGTAYTITGELPTDDTLWTTGDNRNQQIVMYLIDITLYHLHSRINPRNVPDLRKERYDGNGPNQTGGAVGWLKKVCSGDVNADIPNITPQQGMSIRYGSANNATTFSKNFTW